MKLVYLSESQVPSRQANSVHVMRMCEAFSEICETVVLFAKISDPLRGQDLSDYYGVKKTFQVKHGLWWNGPGANMFFALWSCIKALQQRPEVTYGRNIIASCLLAWLGRSVILELHSPPYAWPVFERWLFRTVSHRDSLAGIVVISNRLRDLLLENCPSLIGKRIIVAHDGARPEPLAESYHKVEDRDFRLGYVGQLSVGRGLGIICALAEANQWAEFHIIGGSPSEVKAMSERHEWLENVKFRGHVEHGRVSTLLQEFDVLLAPYEHTVSIYGSGDSSGWMSPMKIFEYMAAKRPILCSDLPVLHEILENEHSCLFCDPEDVRSWSRQVRRLSENPDIGRRLAQNAYEKLVSEYTWSARTKKIFKTLKIG